jgi:2-polyprenyl-3-methyl-5-hydroxy-6-metoxy-1,4-benzoquinol methylase
MRQAIAMTQKSSIKTEENAEQVFHAENSCLVCGDSGSEAFLKAPDRFHGRKVFHQLVRCPNCSLVWLKNSPSPAQMSGHYGPKYDRIIALAGENSPSKSKGRLKVIDRYASCGTLLDMGCNSGAFLAALESSRWRLFGIEMSPEAARKAEITTGATIFVGDILEANFPPESFDVITCFDVLEHVYSPRLVLQRVHEWLKPGGIFYTQLPNIDSGEARIFKSYWYGLELPRHISHFSPQSLRYLAKSVGLQEVSIKTCANSALEYSLRYLIHNVLEGIRIARPCLAEAEPPRLPWKVIRALLRRTAFPALYRATRVAGSGESMHAVLRKDSGQNTSAVAGSMA